MASKKHSERASKLLASKTEAPQIASEEEVVIDSVPEIATPENTKMEASPMEDIIVEETPAGPSNSIPRLLVDPDADEEEIGLSIDAKIAASRNRLTTSHCLFCTVGSPTIAANLIHMANVHSFFIPDQEYLVDLPGLLTYLGEKVSVGNTCLYCPNGGKEFGSLEAVRAHMRDKSHCKMAYETDSEKLEVSDWYDFESSYPDVEQRKLRREERRRRKEEKKMEEEEREWEEVGDEEEMDEDVEVVEEDEESDDESELVSWSGGWVFCTQDLHRLTPCSLP
jgi:pre-60S factor REI1